MGKLWLPQRVGERWQIVRRLRQLGVLVPGWEQLEVSYLRDLLQKEEHLARQPKPEKQFSTKPKEEVAAALRDVRDFKAARREGRRRIY